MERLLKIQDICHLLGVSRSFIYEWTHVDYIPHYKFPNGVRFRESEVENWLKRRKKTGCGRYNLDLSSF